MSVETVHIPVLPREILELGQPGLGQMWVDGTAGGGGHARLIAQHLGTAGHLMLVDRDPAAAQRLQQNFSTGATVCNASYDSIPELLNQYGLPHADGILLDLGLSSDQLADRERGFSFQVDGPLDMRFDPSCGEPAWEWLARVDEQTLADTIFRYGEERYSRRIARRVVETRRAQPIRTADQLRELIYRSVPHVRTKPARKSKAGGGSTFRSKSIDPATRTFQALRIAVNDELEILERALQRLPDVLAPGGALMIISFHSLEDRLVKYAFRQDPRLQIVTKRPVQATDEEAFSNPRSRSAKLRVARRTK
jgi:16S rRNA (cytosine1402-N4)-methyltransferase